MEQLDCLHPECAIARQLLDEQLFGLLTGDDAYQLAVVELVRTRRCNAAVRAARRRRERKAKEFKPEGPWDTPDLTRGERKLLRAFFKTTVAA